MKKLKSLPILFLSVFMLISCKTEYQFKINAPQKIKVNEKLTVSLIESNNNPFEKVEFFIDGVKINSEENKFSLPINSYKLGKHTITALVFYENKTKKITQSIYFLADTPPKLYTFKIINTYPHDPKAYTQGLEYHNGFLYEGTGRHGTSSLRKVELKTGKVLQRVDLDKQYFGEGITILNEKIHQLTWQEGKGFVYDLNTFKLEKEFTYKKSLEGWGLANNGEKLIKSDGTERIWFLNPETHVEESYIEVYTNTQKVEKLNELEYINGKIYANRWQLNSILIINANTGKVEGVANLNALKAEIDKLQRLDPTDDVLNGIAFDKKNSRMFVTGKHWAKLYEIKLIEKQ